jgi:putative transposase
MRRGTDLVGLVAHSDAGSQFTSVRYSERVDELGAVPSIGSVGDSYDNALAESVNSLYKAEIIYHPDRGPWRTVTDVELATLEWVQWWNNQRIHGYLNDVDPATYEAVWHAQQTQPQLLESK